MKGRLAVGFYSDCGACRLPHVGVIPLRGLLVEIGVREGLASCWPRLLATASIVKTWCWGSGSGG